MANECKISKNWSIKKETFMNSMKTILYTEKLTTTFTGYECYFALEQCDDLIAIYFFDKNDNQNGRQIEIKEMKLFIPSANFAADLLAPINVPKKSHFDGYKNAVIIKRQDIVYGKKKFFVENILKLEFRGIIECVTEVHSPSLGQILWYSESQKDFTFVIGNRKIKAHKLIIREFSTVLTEAFKQNIDEIEIKDFTYPTVDAAIGLCYDVTFIHQYTDVFLDILKFADTYGMPIIKDKISRKIYDKITTKNVCKFANKSIEYKVPALKVYCINFISKCLRDDQSYDGAMDLHDEIIKELYKASVCISEIL